jgi:hypothetical protein
MQPAITDGAAERLQPVVIAGFALSGVAAARTVITVPGMPNHRPYSSSIVLSNVSSEAALAAASCLRGQVEHEGSVAARYAEEQLGYVIADRDALQRRVAELESILDDRPEVIIDRVDPASARRNDYRAMITKPWRGLVAGAEFGITEFDAVGKLVMCHADRFCVNFRRPPVGERSQP